MTDRIPPCMAGDIDPDDWFIEKDGRQYPEDDLLSPEERASLELREPGLLEEAEAERLKENLRRRRHAKDACYRCPLRTQCLQIALTDEPAYGTWGGYYREELKEIRKLRDERQKARESQQTDTADEE